MALSKGSRDVEQNPAGRYKDEASRIRREAETMISDTVRFQLLEIARQYELLADSVLLTRRGRGY
jgi:hypothetical protein